MGYCHVIYILFSLLLGSICYAQLEMRFKLLLLVCAPGRQTYFRELAARAAAGVENNKIHPDTARARERKRRVRWSVCGINVNMFVMHAATCLSEARGGGSFVELRLLF
jgi:hypothetical protein